jgi:hypothetical protein
MATNLTHIPEKKISLSPKNAEGLQKINYFLSKKKRPYINLVRRKKNRHLYKHKLFVDNNKHTKKTRNCIFIVL